MKKTTTEKARQKAHKAGKGPVRSQALKVHVRDLNMAPVERYAAIQRGRGRLLSIGKVDVDLDQLLDRTFLCDRHRCIQWTPHEKKADARPLIDNSCCSRYTVPVTDFDRQRLVEILPKVKKRLAKGHPLNADPELPPVEIDEEDFGFVMRDQPNGACQFVLYEKGLTTCAIHKTCLEEGLDVWTYKPLGCSLWPLAVVDYEREGEERILLTTYSRATGGIFDETSFDRDDEDAFACLVDQDPKYDPFYRSVEGVITHLFGAAFYRELDQAAQKRFAARG